MSLSVAPCFDQMPDAIITEWKTKPQSACPPFWGFFLLFAVLEAIWPRLDRVQGRPERWFTNLSIIVIDRGTAWLTALLFPLLAVGATLDAQANGWGPLNSINLPYWFEVVIAILILDFAIRFQHLLAHKIPLFWRFHRVHHADRDFDVTTALRFHPVEIVFSMLLKVGVIYLLGPATLAVILFEVILNGTAMFNHANIGLPIWLDRIVRRVLVTPDMHRVHHSNRREEHDSNYGFSLSIWDRLFRTYVDQPDGGHENMTIGLEWQDEKPARLGWVLALPFFQK